MKLKIFFFSYLFFALVFQASAQFLQQSQTEESFVKLLTIYEKTHWGSRDTSQAKYDTLRMLLESHRDLRQYAKDIKNPQKKAAFINKYKPFSQKCFEIAQKEQETTFLNENYSMAQWLSIELRKVWKDEGVVTEFFTYHSPATGKNFAKIDDYARKLGDKPPSLERLAKALTAPYKDDLSKVRSIYTWITQYISYDYDVLNERIKKAKNNTEVIRRKRGICADYSSLFEELCSKAGIEALYITGYAKGAGYEKGEFVRDNGKANHAWNVVKIEGKWYLIECTWAASLKRFRNFYFLANPLHLIYTHCPEFSEHQFFSETIDLQTFENLPDLYPDSFLENEMLIPNELLKQYLDPKQIGIIEGRLAAPLGKNKRGK